LEGTRVTIHTELANWANNNVQEMTTLWVNGMAGTGKTAIASTFARNMKDQGILGATFFIDRQQAGCQDLRRIVQTLAYNLAKHSHEQLRALWTVLWDNPVLECLSYQEQMQLLIQNPLNVARPGTLVIVINELDKCGAVNGASLLETLLKFLACHPIKLFVTGRNKDNILDIFRHYPHTPYRLQAMEVLGDVQLYWEHNLDELRYRKRLPDWRSEIDVKELVVLTGHLFIYATTVFKIIRNTRTSPIKKLRELLETSRSGIGSAIAFGGPERHGPLEKLYIHILEQAVKDDDGYMIAEYAAHLHDILEVVIFAQAPITTQALSDLLRMNLNDLDSYLSPLHSMLQVSDDTSAEGVVRPLHQSFPDFVRQQGTVVHPKLTMDNALAHKNVAERCFSQLNKLLHFDMCDIKDASLFNCEVSDLPSQMNKCVSAALRYSCRYWLSHFLEHIRAARWQAQMPVSLDVFCAQHLLHWVEVLSLTGDINEVHRVMPGLISIMNVRFLYLWYWCSALKHSLELSRLERLLLFVDGRTLLDERLPVSNHS
jgi:hypothetical protein